VVAAGAAAPSTGPWPLIRDALTRPYRVTVPMVVLVSLVPLYVFIPELVRGRRLYVPAVVWDRLIPVVPAWALVYGALYGADPPYNCFPSLHVAHSFVSALTCHRLHRGVGAATLAAAALVGLSTLYTKQHYLLDVVAGVALAFAAHALFLRRYPRGRVPELHRRDAPILAVGLLAVVVAAVAALWLAHRWGLGPMR
jgi:membrane-associated phospholipid phosphatase